MERCYRERRGVLGPGRPSGWLGSNSLCFLPCLRALQVVAACVFSGLGSWLLQHPALLRLHFVSNLLGGHPWVPSTCLVHLLHACLLFCVLPALVILPVSPPLYDCFATALSLPLSGDCQNFYLYDNGLVGQNRRADD